MRKEDEMRNFVIGFIVACVLFCAVGCSENAHELIEAAYRTGYDEGYSSARDTVSESMHDLKFQLLAGDVFDDKYLTSVGARLNGEEGFVGFGEWKRFCKGVDERLQGMFDDMEDTDENYTYDGVDYGSGN